MSGIHGHSTTTADESYIIFSTHNSVALTGMNLELKPLMGSYKGTIEASWIINARHYDEIDNATILGEQESILILGPINGAGGTRPATLHYLDGRLPESLGYFIEVPEGEALASDAWTLDGDTYYVCKHRPYDGAMKRTMEHVRC